MLFTLEALQAERGDALLLYYGPSNRPHLVVIDGGPKGVYRASLRPRLSELRSRLAPDGELAIELLMVSHIDDDHIQGVVDLMRELRDLKEEQSPLPWRIRTLWYNSFDDIVGNRAEELRSSLGAARLAEHTGLVVASVGQGRELRQIARLLSIGANTPFTGLVAAPKKGRATAEFEGGLKLTVLSPDLERVAALHDQWEKEVVSHGWQARAAAYADESVYNLSSLVVLAEYRKKTMLLTGDARGDDILAGLRAAGILKSEPLHVDVLKLPHHGSERNVETDFFRRVIADHYVISANGEYHNPDLGTFKMIEEARGDAPYTLHLTNRDGAFDLGKKLKQFFAKSKMKKRQVVYREEKALSLAVDLLDASERPAVAQSATK